jgi:maleylacetate reductase
LPDRTPVTVAYACEAMRRFYAFVTRAVADSRDTEARGECLIGAWLAGTVLTAGTGLNHKLAHVMGGYGLPHAETHAVLLPHTTRFNLAAGGEAAERLREVLHTDDPAAAIEELVRKLGITKGLRALGFSEAKIDDAAGQIAQLGIKVPRAVSETDARALISAAL